MKALILLALMFSMVCPAHAEEAYQATAKVWDAMGRKNWDAAIAQANRVIRIWGHRLGAQTINLKNTLRLKMQKNTATLMK